MAADLKAIEKVAAEVTGEKPDTDDFRVAVILLAALNEGATVPAVVKLTGYRESFVRRISRRLIRNGVWENGVTACNWDDPDNGGISFLMDVNVGLGLVERACP